MRVVIDTSVWVDFFRGQAAPHVDRLEKFVRSGEAVLGDLIVSEILRGVTDDREFAVLERHFIEFPVYPMVGLQVAVHSARNYRRLRARGITVRKTVDCWIATFCIERGFHLLHNDRDFDVFEKHLGLRVV